MDEEYLNKFVEMRKKVVKDVAEDESEMSDIA